MGGLGDSLILVGGSAEALSSSTVSVAEDSFRLVEDFAEAVANAVDTRAGIKKDPISSRAEPARASKRTARKKPSFVSFGSESGPQPSYAPIFKREPARVSTEFSRYIFQNVEEIPSLAPEILVAISLCFLVSVFSGRSSSKPVSKSLALKHENGTNDMQSGASAARYPTKATTPGRVNATWVLIWPFRVVAKVMHIFFRVACHRITVLLAIHVCVALYLSHSSSVRSNAIAR